MTCFATYNLQLIGSLRNHFRGCGLVFSIDGFGNTEFVSVRLPRKPACEQAALLDDVYGYVNSLS